MALSDTIPLVATAPVVAEVRKNNEPEVKPAPVDAIFNPIPVVSALPLIFWIVPEAVELAVKFKTPPVEVYAPV